MKEINFSWSGFRGFDKSTRITMPKITLFIGRNNVGKSSAYAPLLMLRQTLDARSPETALLSRGPLIDVGPFQDYYSFKCPTNEISFSLDLNSTIPTPFRRSNKTTIPGQLNLSFRSEDGQTPFLSGYVLESTNNETIIRRTRKSAKDDFNVTSTILPTNKEIGRPLAEITALRKGMREERPEGFLFRGFGGLMIPRKSREEKDRWDAIRPWYNAAYELFDLQTDLNLQIQSFLRGISYLGPLRSLHQRTYKLAPEAPEEVGGTGEFAPELLFRLKDEKVTKLVNKWLILLGYGTLQFKELNGEYFQVFISYLNGTKVNIADTGVGLSQVIPLLVQGAVADKNSTLVAQQPEIHLNPAQQSIVADFLIECADQGTRVVIETHSEHILLRLRRRIAENEIHANDVAIYFVENENGSTNLNRINLGESGELDRNEWPSGFFEDQLKDSFALAAAQASRYREKE